MTSSRSTLDLCIETRPQRSSYLHPREIDSKCVALLNMQPQDIAMWSQTMQDHEGKGEAALLEEFLIATSHLARSRMAVVVSDLASVLRDTESAEELCAECLALLDKLLLFNLDLLFNQHLSTIIACCIFGAARKVIFFEPSCWFLQGQANVTVSTVIASGIEAFLDKVLCAFTAVLHLSKATI